MISSTQEALTALSVTNDVLTEEQKNTIRERWLLSYFNYTSGMERTWN